MIRILIIDDHKIFLDGIRAMFADHFDIRVTRVASSGQEALDIVKQQPFEVALLDINMPGMNGIETASLMVQKCPDLKIICLTSYLEKSLITELLDKGVSGYILKNTGREELEKAIRAVVEGKRYLSADAALAMVDATVRNEYADEFPTDDEGPVLTLREKDILRLIAREKTTKEIAAELSISPYTVETHRKNLMRKLKVKSLAGLVRFAVENELS